jgi:hypothetical protein
VHDTHGVGTKGKGMEIVENVKEIGLRGFFIASERAHRSVWGDTLNELEGRGHGMEWIG